ncbi:MAG: hypothetical protein IPM93_24535 [Candidatus Obscuribacter sp.]|nr:hypothetical protein [Candidatus Obscuribacter sp.]
MSGSGASGHRSRAAKGGNEGRQGRGHPWRALPEHYVPGSLTITGAEGPGALKLGAFSYRPASLSVEAIL